MDDTLMTTAELAHRLGVPKATIYQWRYRGTAPRAVKVGKHTRYRRSDVEAWVEAHLDTPNNPEGGR